MRVTAQVKHKERRAQQAEALHARSLQTVARLQSDIQGIKQQKVRSPVSDSLYQLNSQMGRRDSRGAPACVLASRDAPLLRAKPRPLTHSL